MSDMRIIVDHMKLDYSGLFNAKELFKIINKWCQDRNIHKKEDKCFEQSLPEGKDMEYEISPWKKISDYIRYIYRIRILFKEVKKTEVIKEKKKVKADQGRILLYLDGFIEHDYEHRWDERPMFIFFRALFDRFIYKSYTERFEHRLTHDIHDLYDEIERFLNTYRHYKVVSKSPHF
ncbi:hypothetical protein KY366_01955 [Candidatus Woesearchaeota archaeon]|nr:hypothetical protein [Candidatus Woesearchaeota archaeon]